MTLHSPPVMLCEQCPVMYDSRMGSDQWEPIRLDDDFEPWLQQRVESDRHYAAFEVYMKLVPPADPESGTLGTRRISQMYGKTDYQNQTLYRIAKKFRWAERARAWDESEESGIAGALEFNRRVILREQLRQIAEGNRLLMKVLESMSEDVEGWKPRDLAAWFEVLRRAESDLMGLTRLGGPAQSAAVAGAKAEVSIGSAADMEAQTVEVIEEMRKRGMIPEAITDGNG